MAAEQLRVLVTHPGRQHSHQAAVALAGSGMLAGYWCGVPTHVGRPAWLPRRAWARYAAVPVPVGLVRNAPWVPAVRRAGDRAFPSALARRIDFAACRAFDRWAARQLRAAGAVDAVVACEISAASTFRVARQLGIATLLDAPSIHHRAQDRLHATSDPPALHARIAAVKDAEIALADHVLTVSELARNTYVDAGTPGHKVHALPLGADLELFSPRLAPARPHEGAVVFVFVGATIARKGFDLLLAAFERVATERPHSRLRVVGPLVGPTDWLRANDAITALGPLPQAEVAQELAGADCLVLPSRNDSYGMVVAESLACGTPAIVSEMVGAKDLVTADRTGWVVPVEDAAALAKRMLWCAGHPDALVAMRPACREDAKAATWPSYHRRLTSLLDRLLRGDGRPARPAIHGELQRSEVR